MANEKSKNKLTGLILASVALVFFAGVIMKKVILG
ncbi:MAG: cytochrome oxidase small assembly protein [Burkholderiaceae bacterium]|nr:cytochrome oxidase small assembly protein [Burkholderiaceae bacterium]